MVDYFDWYYWDKVQTFYNERVNKYTDLVKDWYAAKEKNDERQMKGTAKAMARHRKQNQVYKGKAEEAGHYWY